MPLQTTGAISLLDIQNEFGGSSPISLSEYYGPWLASPSIPSSGTISLQDFYGAYAAHIVTEGTDSIFFGYQFASPTFGSVAPTTVNGASIVRLWATKFKSTYTFQVGLQGNRVQSFFNSISNADSQVGTLTTAAATRTYDGEVDFTYWTWGLTDDPLTWDGTGTQEVTFT